MASTRPRLTPDRLRALHRAADAKFRNEREARTDAERERRADRAYRAAQGAINCRKKPPKPHVSRKPSGEPGRHSFTLEWAKANAARFKLDWHTCWTKVMAVNNHIARQFARETAQRPKATQEPTS